MEALETMGRKERVFPIFPSYLDSLVLDGSNGKAGLCVRVRRHKDLNIVRGSSGIFLFGFIGQIALMRYFNPSINILNQLKFTNRDGQNSSCLSFIVETL